ncbi:MAG: PLP-dependent aminotransferase family protein [Aureliella sp.]
MKESRTSAELGFLRLDGRRKTPLFQQLYQAIREAILIGELKPSDRIPSSRDLMDQLGVSRTTVVTAMDRLIAEGYLQSIRGSGTFVSGELPNDSPFTSVPIARTSVEQPRKLTRENPPELEIDEISDYGGGLSSIDPIILATGSPEPFCPGEPALDSFPIAVWSKIVRSTWKKVNAFDLSYGEPGGQYLLKKSVAEYLRSQRGVRCETRQVMIVNGTQQAVELASRILVNPRDKVLFENPGYVSAREAFEKQQAQIVPMRVDENGAVVDEGIRSVPNAKLAYVTPSHQYPIGVTMPIDRRLELLAWAANSDGWILEDDYDSEYRYGQNPVPSLQGLDAHDRTLYVGSFSKVIFPALGLGYIIVPHQLVSIFENALRLASRPASQVDQLVLTEFIREGHFGRHLRRTRKIHSERRKTFIDAIESNLSDKLAIIGSMAGLHCTALLKQRRSDKNVVKKLAEIGIIARALSSYYTPETAKQDQLNGLVMGFASSTPSQIRKRLQLASGCF